MTIDNLIFVGFNKYVVALDRISGEKVWQHKLTHGGYVTLMLDGDRLIVSSSGYMDCLNPLNGRLLWHNPLSRLGTGVTSIASVRGQTSHDLAAHAAAIAAAQASAAS